MKIELDVRPSTNQNPKPFFAIRLFPENNKEMGDLEWGLSVMGEVEKEIIKSCNNGMMYSIVFKNKGE